MQDPRGILYALTDVGFPIINDLNGIQAEPDIRIVTGLSVTF